ncbi:MAG: hypothetical protein K2X41_04820 [Hyphomicrobium sp.]|nr:hypothetical protein [Hyphomicrobium sp.]
MTEKDAFNMIVAAVDKVTPGKGATLTPHTNLATEVFDSLDIMNFLFALEKTVGGKLKEIDEEFNDFSVESLTKIVQRQS